MPNLALRRVPTDLDLELKEEAARDHRSLNREVIARLTASEVVSA